LGGANDIGVALGQIRSASHCTSGSPQSADGWRSAVVPAAPPVEPAAPPGAVREVDAPALSSARVAGTLGPFGAAPGVALGAGVPARGATPGSAVVPGAADSLATIGVSAEVGIAVVDAAVVDPVVVGGADGDAGAGLAEPAGDAGAAVAGVAGAPG
jgi:hypothetical protein